MNFVPSFSLTARIVPSIFAVSGITLVVVPAINFVIVTTAGSKVSMRRVIIICSACTISHATGIGSSVLNGSDAWPPLPVIVIERVSLDAITGPLRVPTMPAGIDEVMCRA